MVCSLQKFNIIAELEIDDELATAIRGGGVNDSYDKESAETMVLEQTIIDLALKCGFDTACGEQYGCKETFIGTCPWIESESYNSEFIFAPIK